MPSINVPDFTSKEFWRTARSLIWSLIVAYAAVVFLGVLTPPEPIKSFMSIVTLVAVWVVVYNFLFGRRS
ncbi:MAG: hypothetical protein EBR02_10505 [Alphaproteobacteria bacterium]|nr:hypothetical protein [Alphaproteobacteria bacterium]